MLRIKIFGEWESRRQPASASPGLPEKFILKLKRFFHVHIVCVKLVPSHDKNKTGTFCIVQKECLAYVVPSLNYVE